MKHILSALILLFFFSISHSLKAQLEKVIVEKYYVSDDSDATDTTGTVLKAGSTTYRVYIDMAPGSKLKSIYGDSMHALKFASDSVFYNHSQNGETFAKNFKITRINNGTTALDTWITLGQTSLAKPTSKTYFGVLKTEDRDGSIVGGVNNDGGSKPVLSGLLVNQDPSTGIPLTTSDGLDTMFTVPMASDWNDYGISDSSIFGSLVPSTQFISKNARLQLYNGGVSGVIPDSNQVLVVQLTTKGKLSFEMNIEIIDKIGNAFKYVAKNGSDSLSPIVHLAADFTYPVPCGCNDPSYIEFSKKFGCPDPSACKNKVVFGCMDKEACNYDPNANLNVPLLCCYPGFCNDRDLSVVCPFIGIKELTESTGFNLYPDPVIDQLNLKIISGSNKEIFYSIYDSMGRLLLEKNSGTLAANSVQQIDVAALPAGLYLFRVTIEGISSGKKFIKN